MNLAVKTVVALSLIIAIGIEPNIVGAEAEHETAVWVAKQAHFDYVGVTTRYTCYRLRDKIRQLLLDMGARSDLAVTPTGCDGGQPTPFPGVDIKIATPKRATDSAASDAVWKPVELGGTGKLEGSDCELAEQMVQKVLPLFEVRKVQMNSSCTPYQLPTGMLSLTLEVLAIDAKP